MSPEVELIAMEYFPSSELDPVKLSVAKVKEADAYIGIFGWRYGSIDKESKMSVTEVEYRSALAGRLPLLLYLASAEMEISPAAVDTGKNALRIKRLKKEIQESHTVQHFTTPEDLARRAAADIHGLLRRVPSLTKTDSLELPDGPVGPEVNPAHPFVLCHVARPTKIEKFEEITLYVDLYYEEGTEEYEKTIASVDRVVYQLHKTFPVPVIPMQNWRNPAGFPMMHLMRRMEYITFFIMNPACIFLLNMSNARIIRK